MEVVEAASAPPSALDSPPALRRRPSFSLIGSPRHHHRAVPSVHSTGLGGQPPPRWRPPTGASTRLSINRLRKELRTGLCAAPTAAAGTAAVCARLKPPFQLHHSFVDDTAAKPPLGFASTAAIQARIDVAFEGRSGSSCTSCTELSPRFVQHLFGWSHATSEPFMLLNELVLSAALQLRWHSLRARMWWTPSRISVQLEGTADVAPSIKTVMCSRVVHMLRALSHTSRVSALLEIVHAKTGLPVTKHPAVAVTLVGVDAMCTHMQHTCGVDHATLLQRLPADSALVVHILPERPQHIISTETLEDIIVDGSSDASTAALEHDALLEDTGTAAAAAASTGDDIITLENLDAMFAQETEEFSLVNSPRAHHTSVDLDVDAGGSVGWADAVAEAAAEPTTVDLGDPQWAEVFFWNLRQLCATMHIAMDRKAAAIEAAWEQCMAVHLRHLHVRPCRVMHDEGTLLVTNRCPSELRSVSPLILGRVPLSRGGGAGGAANLAIVPLPRAFTQMWRFVLKPKGGGSELAVATNAWRDLDKMWEALCLRAVQHRLHTSLLPLLCSHLATPSWWLVSLGSMPCLLTTNAFTEELTFCTIVWLQHKIMTEWFPSKAARHPAKCERAKRSTRLQSVLRSALEVVVGRDVPRLLKRLGLTAWPDGTRAWWERMFTQGLLAVVGEQLLTPATVLALLRQALPLNPWCQRHALSFVTDDPLFSQAPLAGEALRSTGIGLMLSHIQFVTSVCLVQVQRALDAAVVRRGGAAVDNTRMLALLNAHPHVTLVHSHNIPPAEEQQQAVVVGNLQTHQTRGAADSRVDVTVDLVALLGSVNWMQMGDVPVSLERGDVVTQTRALTTRARLKLGEPHMGVMGPLSIHVADWAAVQRTNIVLIPSILAALVPQVLRQATSFVSWEVDSLRTEVCASCFSTTTFISALSGLAAGLRSPRRGLGERWGDVNADPTLPMPWMLHTVAQQWWHSADNPRAVSNKKRKRDAPEKHKQTTLLELAPLGIQRIGNILRRARKRNTKSAPPPPLPTLTRNTIPTAST